MPTTKELLAAAGQRLGLYGYLLGGHKPAPHHRPIIDVITDPKPGTRDLIVMPPGHAKTTWATTYGVAHYIGNNPDKSVLILSESGTRAKEVYSAIQQQLDSDLFQAIFPDFKPDKSRGWAKTYLYSTAAPKQRPDPTLACAGVGGPVIGRRPDLIVIDDPTDEETATSVARRQSQELWFKRTLLTRLTQDAKVVVIMTRWHEADIAGFLTDPELDLGWRRTLLPAEAEKGLIHPPELFKTVYGGIEGRPLWPEMYPAEYLRQQQASMGAAAYRCVYQGDPSDLGGALFKLKYLTGYNRTWVDHLIRLREEGRKEALEVWQYWDLAFSVDLNGDPDYTVGITLGVDRNGRYYVLDLVRGRWEITDTVARMVAAARKWKPKLVGIEQVGAQLGVVQLAKKRFALPTKKGGYGRSIVKGVKVDRDKVHRAQIPIALTEPTPHPDDPDRMVPGLLRFDHSAPWWPVMRQELIGFPNAAHDDITDALSGVTKLAQDRARRVISRARIG